MSAGPHLSFRHKEDGTASDALEVKQPRPGCHASDHAIATQKYWPYGAARSCGITQTDKLYTGQQVETGDSALGLYSYKARFYSTALGRFVSADSLVNDGLNRYTYGRDNPLRYTDPTGRCVLGLPCSPKKALEWLACASSIDGCLAAFRAEGLDDSDIELIERVHRLAAFLVPGLEFQKNFSDPRFNPYLNGKALQSAFRTWGFVMDPTSLLFTFANPVVHDMLGLRDVGEAIWGWATDPYNAVTEIQMASGATAAISCSFAANPICVVSARWPTSFKP